MAMEIYRNAIVMVVVVVVADGERDSTPVQFDGPPHLRVCFVMVSVTLLVRFGVVV